MKGLKYNADDKIRLDLVPPESLYGIARGLMTGLVKGYPERNWELGLPWRTLYGATLRHLTKWVLGIEIDQETKDKFGYEVTHLDLALCELAMLHAHVVRGLGKDNRNEEEAGTPAQSKGYLRYLGEDTTDS